MRRAVKLLLIAGLGGCSPSPGGMSPPPDLVGLVDFGPTRSTQTTINEIGVAATVSLIEATTNRTVTSTITDASGRFALTFRTWRPGLNGVYFLEAVKGLNQNLAGNSVARVRTLGQWKTNGWAFMTPGVISITAGSTAVSVLASHLGTASVPVDGLIGKLLTGTPDNTLAPVTKDTFVYGGTGITNAQYHKVYELVEQALDMDTDPVDRIVPVDGTFALKATASGGGVVVAPTLDTMVPSSGPIGAFVTLYGKDFGGTREENTVMFGTRTATVVSSDPNQLVVQVPAGATTGTVTVRARGVTSGALPFTVTASDPTDIGGSVAPR